MKALITTHRLEDTPIRVHMDEAIKIAQAESIHLPYNCTDYDVTVRMVDGVRTITVFPVEK